MNTILTYSIVVINLDIGVCLVGQHVLPHELTGNHCRDFHLHDPPKLLEDVPLTEHECGTCMMVLRHISAVLCEVLWTTPVMTEGQVEEEPLHGLNAPQMWILWICIWEGNLNALVYAAAVDNEEAFHHCTVHACQSMRYYPGIFERMPLSMMRRVEACVEYHWGRFEQLL
jgi:hypothetical protein